MKWYVSHPVCAEAQTLCSILFEATEAGLALDLSPELTRAVTNIICALCFNSSYRRGDPDFEAMLHYSQGIVDTVAKDSLVDIFPWLQVDHSNTDRGQFSYQIETIAAAIAATAYPQFILYIFNLN